MMIYPNEDKLIGSWLLENGIVKEDNVCIRIKSLTVDYLLEIATKDNGWERLYKDPNDGRYWELSYPNSDWQGGGPPLLINLSQIEVQEKYGIFHKDHVK